MKKLNPLPPTLRENQRYIVFKIISKKKFEVSEVIEAIWKNTLRLYGDVGTSELSMWIPANLYNKERKEGIVKCNHLSVEKIRFSLTTIREINEERVIIKVLGTTGTIKSAKTKYLGASKTLEDYSTKG